MKYLPTYFVFLTLSMALLTGCPKPDTQSYDLDPDFVAYSFFPQGSYWIYEQDSATGVYDSVYVSESHHLYRGDDDYDAEFETYTYVYTLRQTKWSVMLYPLLKKEPNFLFTMYEMEKETQQNSAFHLFKYVNGGDTLRDGHPGVYISARHPKITINGTTYSDAITVTHPIPYYGNPTRQLTFVKHVGIVRRTFWDGTTWSLLRYHIP